MTPRMMRKMAEELEQQLQAPPPEHPAKTLAKGIAGLGVGMGAGYVGALGADKLLKKVRGYGLQKPGIYYKGVPIVAGALGLAYPYFVQAHLNKMRSDHMARQGKKKGEQDR